MGAWGKWTIDMGRYAREHWLFGLTKLVVEHGFLTCDEIESRVAALRKV